MRQLSLRMITRRVRSESHNRRPFDDLPFAVTGSGRLCFCSMSDLLVLCVTAFYIGWTSSVDGRKQMSGLIAVAAHVCTAQFAIDVELSISTIERNQ